MLYRSCTRSPSTGSGEPSPAKAASSELGAGAQSSASSLPPPTINIPEEAEPVTAVPSLAAQDIRPDQAQIDLPPLGQEATKEGGQDPSTSGAAGQPYVSDEIDWNGTPWEEDIMADHEDLMAVKGAIITLSQNFNVSSYFCSSLVGRWRLLID